MVRLILHEFEDLLMLYRWSSINCDSPTFAVYRAEYRKFLFLSSINKRSSGQLLRRENFTNPGLEFRRKELITQELNVLNPPKQE